MIRSDCRNVTGNVESSPTAASTAIGAGQPAVGRSFRFHRPRGPICGGGYCNQCEVATTSGSDLACCIPPQAQTARRDWLRPIGRLAERWPPWFYERRFLRPQKFRRLPLHVLRYLSSAFGLAPQPSQRRLRQYVELKQATVVVGNGEGPEGAYRVGPSTGQTVIGIYPDQTIGVLTEDNLVSVRFERLILATGSYERLPPIAGNDLPGVIGLDAADIYGRVGALRPGTRIAVWAPVGEQQRVADLVEQHSLTLVWNSDRAPLRIAGRGRVEAITTPERIDCELFVIGVRQPAIELAIQAGAKARLTESELPILVLDQKPDWLEVVGAAAATSSNVPDVEPYDEAFACLCEDVRIGDLRNAVQQGFDQPELVKRRTGAMTGPCQGKMCSSLVLAALRTFGLKVEPTTVRPLARPVTLGELAADA